MTNNKTLIAASSVAIKETANKKKKEIYQFIVAGIIGQKSFRKKNYKSIF